MKTDIETLKDTFQLGHDSFYASRQEALKTLDYYHNRQYSSEQLAILEKRGQPAETFNIIKMFTRMLLGYYSTVINTVKALPVQEDDVYTASVMSDLVDQTFRINNFLTEGDKIKLDAILTGLMCSYVDVVETGEVDEFNRPKRQVTIHHVPSMQIILDPMSTLENYTDARYIHRFKWMSKDEVRANWGDKWKQLEDHHNHLEIEESEFEYTYNSRFQGRYRVFENYLIVHTIIQDDEGKWWSIFWCNDIELERKEITYKDVKMPYRVQKVHASNRTEHYGLYREILQTQDAINQALLKIQLMSNSEKVLAEESAVENFDQFKDSFYRVNAIIKVKSLAGIKIESLTREVAEQYVIIDKGLDRIQRILGINDSFLGLAYASDSGKKVKLQQNASAVALRHITSQIESFYRLLGWDIMSLIKQYYTAHDVIRVADNYSGFKWVEINRPVMLPTGKINQLTGQPEMTMVFDEVVDPASNEPLTDDEGNIIIAPIPTQDTEIAFTKADIEVDTTAYNDEDEINQQLLDNFLNGSMGVMLSQVNPVGYFQAGQLAIKNIRSKYSPELAGILEQTSQMLSGNMAMQQSMMQGDLDSQQSVAQAANSVGGN